jgi:predicted dehydrogenase
VAAAKIGIIGCGNIAPAYFKGLRAYPFLEVTACADLDLARARARAQEFGVPRACTVEELLADPEIQFVVNLTIPRAHAEVNRMILEAGKIPYVEKPFAVTLEDARRTLEIASKRGRRTGGAPDTFLGGGIQTARKLLDDGAIGRPVAASAFVAFHGHESWHPSPEFYYQPGGGPMLDMGPYYLTAMVCLLGPARRVAALTKTTFLERTITSEPKRGQRIQVETTTHLSGTVEFENAVLLTMIASFDVWAHNLPRMELYGEEGSMMLPDPNTFRGPVLVRTPADKEWRNVPLTHSEEVSRGIGVADLVRALERGRPSRVAGEQAAHVLEIMLAFDESSRTGKTVDLKTRCERPAALPPGLGPGEMD